MIASKGVNLTGSYATVLTANPWRLTTEFINYGTATAYLVVGGGENDADLTGRGGSNSRTHFVEAIFIKE